MTAGSLASSASVIKAFAPDRRRHARCAADVHVRALDELGPQLHELRGELQAARFAAARWRLERCAADVAIRAPGELNPQLRAMRGELWAALSQLAGSALRAARR